MTDSRYTISILIFFLAVTLVACNPFKVTDPADSGFDPQKFRFEDYDTEKKLLDAVTTLFPEGTKRERVEKTLVKYAQAKPSEKMDLNKDVAIGDGYTIIYGRRKGDNLRTVWVVYEENDGLLKIYVHYMSSKEALPYIFLIYGEEK